MVSPSTSSSTGGEPQQPLWCHWVKTCQAPVGAGKSEGKSVLQAYQRSFPSTSLNPESESLSSLRVPFEATSPWCSSARNA